MKLRTRLSMAVAAVALAVTASVVAPATVAPVEGADAAWGTKVCVSLGSTAGFYVHRMNGQQVWVTRGYCTNDAWAVKVAAGKTAVVGGNYYYGGSGGLWVYTQAVKTYTASYNYA